MPHDDRWTSIWFPSFAGREEVAADWRRLDAILGRNGVRLNEHGWGQLQTSDGGSATADAPGVVYGRDDPEWVDQGGGLEVERLTPGIALFAFEFAEACSGIVAAGRMDSVPVVALLSESRRNEIPSEHRAYYEELAQVVRSPQALYEALANVDRRLAEYYDG